MRHSVSRVSRLAAMKPAAYLTLLALFMGASAAQAAPASAPFLKMLADAEGGVTVAYGQNQASQQAGEVIAEAIRGLEGHGDWDKLVAASEFDKQHFDETGQTHVIAVGQLEDNAALRGRDWLPTWWMDYDWYQNEYEFALSPREMGLPYQYDSGFLAAGYGHWPNGQSGIGYVEVDRSHYFMEWMVRSRFEKVVDEENRDEWGVHTQWQKLSDIESPTYPTDFPLRFIVRVTGSGGEGVVAAAEVFAQNSMLNGAVLAGDAKADSGPKMFNLPQARYTTELPYDPPKQVKDYTYQGWLLPAAFQYDGFANETGIQPAQMYRIKYAPGFGITNFWTSPHRRSGQFEVAIMVFDSVQQAKKAGRKLTNSLHERDSYKNERITGFNGEREGKVLFTESIPEPAGKAILDQTINAWQQQ